MPVTPGLIPATTQCTKFSASGSTTTTASSTASGGTLLHCSVGAASPPVHVNRASITPPSAHGAAIEKSVDGPETTTAIAAVDATVLSTGSVGRAVSNDSARLVSGAADVVVMIDWF